MSSYCILTKFILVSLILNCTSGLCSDTNEQVPNYKQIGCYIIKCSDWSILRRFYTVKVTSKDFESLRKAVDTCAVQAVKLRYKMFGVRLIKNNVECWKEITDQSLASTTLKAKKPKGKCRLGVGRGNGMMAYNILVREEKTCGKSNFGKHMIIGGELSSPGDWPWQVGVYYNGSFICGGVIIKPTAVLTAAHCVSYHKLNGPQYDTKSAHLYKVRVGDFNLFEDEPTEVDYEVSVLIKKDDWKYPMPENDIGMLRLRKPIVMSSIVGPICLPEANEQSPLGKTCYVSGWGRTDVTSPLPSQYLRQAKMPTVTLNECREKIKDTEDDWLKIVKVTENMLCGGTEGSEMSICHGDSGGPYVCKNDAGEWILQGIVSWMSPVCDSSEAFSVFTRVSKYKQWIYLNSILRI